MIVIKNEISTELTIDCSNPFIIPNMLKRNTSVNVNKNSNAREFFTKSCKTTIETISVVMSHITEMVFYKNNEEHVCGLFALNIHRQFITTSIE